MENIRPRARIRLEYRVRYPDPIQVRAGESVQIQRPDDDDPAWLWCRAADGREGWMPIELLSRRGALATVLRDYSAKELGVQPEDEVDVEEVRHGWVLVRNAQGQVGWIPQSHIDM
jgi:SH3-like domain-containing protein